RKKPPRRREALSRTARAKRAEHRGGWTCPNSNGSSGKRIDPGGTGPASRGPEGCRCVAGAFAESPDAERRKAGEEQEEYPNTCTGKVSCSGCDCAKFTARSSVAPTRETSP